MSYMSWDSSMAIGNPVIDAEHKALLDQINDLVDAVFDIAGQGRAFRSQMAHLLARLRAAMAELFHTEEALMGRCGFPNAAEHREQHHDLIVQFDTFVRTFAAGAEVSLAHVVRFLREWFEHHTEHWDRSFGAWLRAGALVGGGVSVGAAASRFAGPERRARSRRNSDAVLRP
jgi:hemerythrin